MRLQNVLVLLSAVICSVHGQGGLTELASHMPKCSASLACFMKELPKSSCATNLTSECLCSNTELNAAVAVCASKTCTVYELLQTKNVSSKGCGVPVRNKGTKFTIIGITGIVVAALAFALRMAASLGKRGRQMSWDDLTMGIVLALAIPPAVFAPTLVQNGLGRDIWTLNAEEITNVLRFYFYGEIFYVVALGISKISILFFYLRVFPAKSFRMIIYALMGLSLAYTIAFLFATTFQCTPVSQAWTQWDGLHEGTCNNIHLQGWIAAAINIVLDIVVMILPLKQLAGLQMNMVKKLMVMAMFSVGLFVVVVSVIRLESLIHFANTKNVIWDYFEAGYWSLIEIDVSIICGCMPAQSKLLARAWSKIKTTIHASKRTSDSSSSGYQSKSGGTHSSAPNQAKAATVKIKPKTGDEGDFVPLVNMENNHGAASLAGSAEHEKSSEDCIMRTTSVELSSNSEALTAASMINQSLPNWSMGKPAMRRDHV